MWNIGQQVICINGSFPRAVWEWCEAVPIEGRIYTIRAIHYAAHYYTGERRPAVHLSEIMNPVSSNGREAYFCAGRFASLESREQCEQASEFIFTGDSVASAI